MAPGKINLTFNLVSDPFRGEPVDADRFYAAAGRFLMVWGRIEGNLDIMLGHIANLPDWQAPKSKIEELVPASMKRKADMWKHAFKTISSLQSEQPRSIKFMSELMELNDHRAMLVHGKWMKFINAHPLTVEIIKRKRNRGVIRTEIYDVTISHVEEMIETAKLLHDRLAALLLFAISRPRPQPNARRS